MNIFSINSKKKYKLVIIDNKEKDIYNIKMNKNKEEINEKNKEEINEKNKEEINEKNKEEINEKNKEEINEKNKEEINEKNKKINNIKQKKGLKRNTIDKYYTKNDIVDLCLSFVKKNIQININDLIIEPSAGNGSFINGIKLMTDNYLFYDLEPENEEIIKQDYIILNNNEIIDKYDNIHIIGNPPFGRQSSLVTKFIKKSCEFCNSISFILPKSFKKDSFKKKFPLNFHLIFQYDLPKNSFLVNNSEYDVPCIFQIWKKDNFDRIIQKKLEPYNFIFVKKTENPDISVRRVGINAGIIDRNINEKNIQSHYFIKFTNNKSIIDNINLLSNIKYEFNNTVGPKSISKQELIYKFNPLL